MAGYTALSVNIGAYSIARPGGFKPLLNYGIITL